MKKCPDIFKFNVKNICWSKIKKKKNNLFNIIKYDARVYTEKCF